MNATRVTRDERAGGLCRPFDMSAHPPPRCRLCACRTCGDFHSVAQGGDASVGTNPRKLHKHCILERLVITTRRPP